jgi:hypothetical protein
MPPALFALLLAAADPSAATAETAPVQTQAEATLADRIPAGAPKDDFGFVAWCDGVLAGHMDLAERVASVLPVDPVQQKIGQAYLQAYEKALAGSKEGHTEAGHKRAEAAREVGWKNWEPARKANKQLAADSYLAWQLPGHCEKAAIRLSGDQDLFRMSPTVQEVEAMGEEAPVANAQAAAAKAAAANAAPAAPTPAAATSDDLNIKTIPDPKPQPVETPDPNEVKERNFDRFWEQDKPTQSGPGPGPQ